MISLEGKRQYVLADSLGYDRLDDFTVNRVISFLEGEEPRLESIPLAATVAASAAKSLLDPNTLPIQKEIQSQADTKAIHPPKKVGSFFSDPWNQAAILGVLVLGSYGAWKYFHKSTVAANTRKRGQIDMKKASDDWLVGVPNRSKDTTVRVAI